MKKSSLTLTTLIFAGLSIVLTNCTPALYSEVDYGNTIELQERNHYHNLYSEFSISSVTKNLVDHTIDTYQYTFRVSNIGSYDAAFYEPSFGVISEQKMYAGYSLNTGIHNGEFSYFALTVGQTKTMSFLIDGEFENEEIYLYTQAFFNMNTRKYIFNEGKTFNKEETIFRDDYHSGYTFDVSIDSEYDESKSDECYYLVVEYQILDEAPFSVVHKTRTPSGPKLELYSREDNIAENDIKVNNAKYYLDIKRTIDYQVEDREYRRTKSLNRLTFIFFAFFLAVMLIITIPVTVHYINIFRKRKKDEK